MEAEINEAFEDISRKLFRNSLNYCATFKLFPCGKTAGRSLQDLVQMKFGDHAVVGGSAVSTTKQVIDELSAALVYRGDHGSYPSPDYLESNESKEDCKGIISSIQKILDRSVRVVAFRLKEGHPFYPVFWDFAFLIETDQESILLIASSSD
jgi:hypothetical protein